MKSYEWKFKVYCEWDQVDGQDFVERWHEWINASDDTNVFYHPSVAIPWVSVHRELHDILPLYCVAEYDTIIVFMPLILWQKNIKACRLRVIQPVGYDIYDYHDPIVTGTVTNELIGSYWKMLTEKLSVDKNIKFDKLILNGIRMSGTGDVWKKEQEVCPYTDLNKYSDYEDFLKKSSSNLRNDISRRLRRYSEIGKVDFHVYDVNDYEDAINGLSNFIRAHKKRWPQAHKKKEIEGILKLILKNGLPFGIIHFSELKVKETTVSWHFGFAYKKRFYYYLPVINEDYAKMSPGKIHLAFIYKYCFANQYRICDLLRGEEGYKRKWAIENGEVYEMTYNKTGLNSSVKIITSGAVREFKKLIGD